MVDPKNKIKDKLIRGAKREAVSNLLKEKKELSKKEKAFKNITTIQWFTSIFIFFFLMNMLSPIVAVGLSIATFFLLGIIGKWEWNIKYGNKK